MKVEQQALGADESETLFIFVIIKVIPLESFVQSACLISTYLPVTLSVLS